MNSRDATTEWGRRKWYDSSKVIWGLFFFVGVCLVAFAGTVWASLSAVNGRTQNHENRLILMENELKHCNSQLGRHGTMLERIDEKIDELRNR